MDDDILKACVYVDGRYHIAFHDGSGLILHQGGQYSTYFSSEGEVTRQITWCVPGILKPKFLKAIKLCNSFAFSPTAILSDDIYKTIKKDSKISIIHWLNPGWISVVAKGTETELFHFQIDPDREDVLIIEKAEDGSYFMKSSDNEAEMSINPNGLLLRFTFPLLLQNKKPEWSQNKNQRFKLSYEYAIIQQIFSTKNYPPYLSGPLSILWAAFKCGDQEVIREPSWYQTTELSWDRRELATALPTPIQGEIWNNDTISPSVQLFTYYASKVMTVWEPKATYYTISNNSTETLIHEDQSFLISNGEFFTYFADSIKKFTSETVPPLIRNRFSSYSPNEIVKMCMEIQNLPVYQKPQAEADNGIFLDGIKVENHIEGLATFTAYNDRSIRVLFEDRTVIRIHPDMRVTAVNKLGEVSKISLDSPFGFEEYIPVCVEFYTWAFTSQVEKLRMEEERAEREAIVNAELLRTQRFLQPVPKMYESMNEIPDDKIKEALEATQRQIAEIHALLHK
ncbi:unnamed protein product [Blepharisma stoltei]|uniref:C5orf34-like C-terminal domain-containing protein n=1 Tax=Blepharisma stoltei TaxID=1481888 RepID=A0AAU9IJN2_9CILI|nr:unnamed protein product [Blepharisma stoltei]